ncbi:hypothetical protein [Paraburkholderia sp. GAS334]|uniref:hypothetical protein n=1 Tax=Paraburkholderia sp. GAS334 TaxID=3035131 RepID=UPI003D23D5CC
MAAALAVPGPIAGAETFLLSMRDDIKSGRLRETGVAFEEIFARHPNVFLARARDLLASFGAGRRPAPLR